MEHNERNTNHGSSMQHFEWSSRLFKRHKQQFSLHSVPNVPSVSGISGSLLRWFCIGFFVLLLDAATEQLSPVSTAARSTSPLDHRSTVAVMASVCVILLSIMVSAGCCCSSYLADSTKG